MKVLPKRGMITSHCRACGHSFNLDMRHKLTTFIVKNPPEQSLNKQGTSLTQKQKKRSERKEDDNGEVSKNGEDEFDDEDNEQNVEWFTDVSETAVEARMKDLSTGVKGLSMDNDMEKSEKEKMKIVL